MGKRQIKIGKREVASYPERNDAKQLGHLCVQDAARRAHHTGLAFVWCILCSKELTSIKVFDLSVQLDFAIAK